jgi:hypothetical protein
LPSDSEAYRERARLAAGYRDRAVAAGRGGGGGRGGSKYDRYYQQQNDLYKRTAGAYDTAMQYVNGLMQSGIKGVAAGVLNTGDEGIVDLRAGEYDASNLTMMLQIVNTDPAYATWRAETTAAIRKMDPSFNGQYDFNSIASLGNRKSAGLRSLVENAKKVGLKGDTNEYRKLLAAHSAEQVRLKTVDEIAAYESARVDWLEVANDPNATLAERVRASDDYANTLSSLFDRAKKDGDDIMAGRFNNELLALNGKPSNGQTLWEETTGRYQAGGGEGGDAASTSASMKALRGDVDLLNQRDPNTGQPLYVQARVDKGQIAAEGGEWGVVPVGRLDPNSVAFVKSEGDRGTGAVTAIAGVPVRAFGVFTDQYGQDYGRFGNSQGLDLGMRFTMSDGSSLWSYTDSSGEKKFTTTNPFGGNLPTVKTPDGDQIVYRRPEPKPGEEIGDRFNPADWIDPDKYNPDTNKRMPNDVFLSVPAAEMAVNPKSAYWKYTPTELRTLALANAGGDANKAQRIYAELDEQRAAYIRDPKAPWDTRLRLAAANRNGDLPLITDGYGQGPSVGGLNAPTVPLGALSKESQAAYEKIGGRTNQQIVNATAQDILKSWGLGALVVPGQHPSDWKAKGTASSTLPPLPKPGTGAPILPNESRQMANNLIGGIWQNVFGGTTITPPSLMPGAKPPTQAGRPMIGPPAPTAPPKPTQPKPSTPPPAAKPPALPTPGLPKPAAPKPATPKPLTAQQQAAVNAAGAAFGSSIGNLAQIAFQYGTTSKPKPPRGSGGGTW